MEYEVTIGLEVHAQILTASKMFSASSADYANAPPNTILDPVCLGLPGALPVINRHAIELAALTGLALNCQVQPENIISRKNYFYPDLPSSYQRTQFEDPICVHGWVEVESDMGSKRIRIGRLHIEEDTGKRFLMPDGSMLVDFNRAGVPLMEIVSEPDIGSPDEARRYFQKLRQILMWIGVNTGNMEDGALRCDANISVRPKGQQEYGAKVEIKNMNSFRSVERALVYEADRQIKELKAGNTILQSTRGWNDATGKTVLQRVKEDSNDYRYFPEPDIPPIYLSQEWIDERRSALPELPDACRNRFIETYELSTIDAETVTSDRQRADYFERAVATAKTFNVGPKEVVNWFSGELLRLLNETGEDLSAIEPRFRPGFIGEVQSLLTKGTITRTSAKEVFEISFRTGQSPTQVVTEQGMQVIGTGDELTTLARDIIAANPKVVADYHSGKTASIKFLVGQIMKATKGQANPQAAQSALEQALSKE
ncbi:MAG: Asp-tRNA(Asn)/Glu-tRNA(Gln) amidotransferase subunit GatB [Chloroflexi bacterium AL-W]|nr:Asp-tRNA(Asn)/Glu-tRNA(Gln) amidotransferase subunit GatB [Chloroflexi bacterium AL-N1]NOK71411.1 Asp-tRNA(Asn)/Glu-tRNA(Gln) amidotransferase subunit GatB [Chloroflexi bacterium AL-N10]NOK78814.1 Asp-tRNA(Asn)/Glu-tRNA(Gln) amidotransferase subunit GatB [Chloroflexi bacterium AL-N5]NOK86232.1 Asp-tRNA(Asn)/Glu-tRNA(Gln) amidotransferase subunit GatB [Chloroflexi bacterium AL-W]NOK93136.1 Asp-tRNA(Asn)/Glu-tRNA(Gln) amidotransferase subunit GatB [Chloroflexi bacterium AL-N15]